ncbi:MAG: hypothetical protein EP330_20525 [Deltaproteobacteria bacterium]|nr:MAG: hypothetical protein EP330_20525 [Deltaproteobacteria bacterium]
MGGGIPEADEEEFEIELDDVLEEAWADDTSPRIGLALQSPDLDVVEHGPAGAGFEAEAPGEDLWEDGDAHEARLLWGKGWDLPYSIELARVWSDEAEVGPHLVPTREDGATPVTDAYSLRQEAPVFIAPPALTYEGGFDEVDPFGELPLVRPPNLDSEATQTIRRKPPEVTEPIVEPPPMPAPPMTEPPVPTRDEVDPDDLPTVVATSPAPQAATPTWMVAALVVAAPVITLLIVGGLAAVWMGTETADPVAEAPTLAVPEVPEPEPVAVQEPVIEEIVPEPEPTPRPRPVPRAAPRPAPTAVAPRPAPAPAPAPVADPEPRKRGLFRRKKK